LKGVQKNCKVGVNLIVVAFWDTKEVVEIGENREDKNITDNGSFVDCISVPNDNKGA
jgi:hypothetical protein